MPQGQVKLSGAAVLLAPFFQRQQRERMQELIGLGEKFMSGQASPEEHVQLMAKNPQLYQNLMAHRQLQQQQVKREQIQRLVQELHPQMPTQAGVAPPTQAGVAPPTQAGVAPPTPVYPSEDTIRNIALRLAALGGSGLEIGRILTEKARAGDFQASAQHREAQTSGVLGQEERAGESHGRLMDVYDRMAGADDLNVLARIAGQAGLLTGRTQDIMGAQFDLARVNQINEDIEQGKIKADYEISKAEADIGKAKADAERMLQQAGLYRAQGDRAKAQAIADKVQAEWMPAIKKAEVGLINAQTLKQRAEGEKAQREGTGVSQPALTAAQRNNLTSFRLWLGGRPLPTGEKDSRGLFRRPVDIEIPPPKTREEAEEGAWRQWGLSPNHPEVKRALDYVFPQQQATSEIPQGNVLVESPDGEVQQQATSEIPQGNVLVESPDGYVGYIPAEQLEEALRQGYKLINSNEH